MIRYNTSNDKLCKIIVKWCKDNNFIYTLDPQEGEKETDAYHFRIFAPEYMKDDFKENIRRR